MTEKEQKVKIKFDNSDLLALLSVRVSEIEAEHVLVVPKEVSNDLKILTFSIIFITTLKRS